MKWLAFLLWILLCAPVQASPVVADISSYRIAIDAGFTGVRLFIFGARNAPGDVVVVIRGPEKQFTVRKKERAFGIWMHRRQLAFGTMPDFYAVASTRPLDTLTAPNLRRLLGIGTDMLMLPPQDAVDKAIFPEFSAALIAHQQTRMLYPALLPLGFMGETLFKATIPFPDTIPKGDYTAEIYLISDNELVGMQTMPIRVEKSGFDAAVYDLAHHYPFLYGVLAVFIALGAGWAAGRMFQRS